MIHFRCVTGSVFVSDYNKSNFSYKQQNNYITAFGTVAITTQLGFYLFKVNNRNKNTRAKYDVS